MMMRSSATIHIVPAVLALLVVLSCASSVCLAEDQQGIGIDSYARTPALRRLLEEAPGVAAQDAASSAASQQTPAAAPQAPGPADATAPAAAAAAAPADAAAPAAAAAAAPADAAAPAAAAAAAPPVAAPKRSQQRRVRATLTNSCDAKLRNIRVAYVNAAGTQRRMRGPVVKPGAKRTLTVRAKWPSAGTVTGEVDGGAPFELAFAVAEDGSVAWTGAAAAVGTAAPAGGAAPAEYAIAGAACAVTDGGGGSGSRAKSASTSSSGSSGGGNSEALGVAKLLSAASATPDDFAATVSERAAAASALALGGADVRVGQARAPLGALDAPALKARPDFAVTKLGMPVDIYILRNDDFVNPINTQLQVSVRGELTEAASLADTGGETELIEPEEANADEALVWNADLISGAAGWVRNSYLTYTPPRTLLAGRVNISYTLTTPRSDGWVLIEIVRQPGDSLSAATDYVRADDDAALEVAVLDNDFGPSALIPDGNGDVTPVDPEDYPDPNEYLLLLGVTQPARGVVEFDAEILTVTYTPNEDFVCGYDRFTYRTTDPVWPVPEGAVGEVKVFRYGWEPGVDAVEAVEDEYFEVPRDRPFALTRLVDNDFLCGGAIAGVSALENDYDDAETGKINKNGNALIWYPPAGGVCDDISQVTFTYSVRWPYIDEEGVRTYEESDEAMVTLAFTPGQEQPDDYCDYGDYEDYGAGDTRAEAKAAKRAAKKAAKTARKKTTYRPCSPDPCGTGEARDARLSKKLGVSVKGLTYKQRRALIAEHNAARRAAVKEARLARRAAGAAKRAEMEATRAQRAEARKQARLAKRAARKEELRARKAALKAKAKQENKEASQL